MFPFSPCSFDFWGKGFISSHLEGDTFSVREGRSAGKLVVPFLIRSPSEGVALSTCCVCRGAYTWEQVLPPLAPCFSGREGSRWAQEQPAPQGTAGWGRHEAHAVLALRELDVASLWLTFNSLFTHDFYKM